MPALRLIHCTPVADARTPAVILSDLWWEFWCKPVELSWLAWSLHLKLMEKPDAGAGHAEHDDRLERPCRTPFIYLVASTGKVRPPR